MACNDTAPETLTQLECVGSLLLYQDENGDVTTIDIADKLPPNIVTALSFDLASKTLTFTNEEGETDVVDLSPCFPESSYDSTLHQVVLDGVTFPLNVSELTLDYATKELVYTDDAGAVNRLDLTPCIPPLSTFSYDPATHAVMHNGVVSQLNCGVPTFNPATCELGYTDEKGNVYSWFIPQDAFALSADGRTLTINPAKGGALNIDIGKDEVTLEMTPEKQLKLTVGNNTTCIQLPNSLVGCSYDQAANELRLIHCDGTEDVKQLATAGLECTTLPDGTQVLCFTSGTGEKKLFNIPAVTLDTDNLTVAGSVLTFTYGGDGNPDTVIVDICQIVAENCNAHFPSIDPVTGEWSFIDNAGETFSYPGFPIRSIKCIDATGAIVAVEPDADACVTIPQHFPQVVSPDGSITVNFVDGVWEIVTPIVTDTWGEPLIAPGAGSDFFGVAYAAGDYLFETPTGNIVCIPRKDQDTDTWGEPLIAPAAGTDFFGVAYAAGDYLFETPTGNIVCIPRKEDVNTFGAPVVATAAGTDFFGVPYAAGDNLYINADGLITCIPSKDDLDTFGEPVVATAAGTDFFGVAYDVGDNLYINANGLITCIPSKDDVDTFGAPVVATAAGTDFFGVAYDVGDNLYINAAGEITCIPSKTDVDTFGAPVVATAAGTDFFGVAYDVGDKLYINAAGEITCIPAKTTAVDTFGAPVVATAAGTDFFGDAYDAGDKLYINADGLVTCIPSKTSVGDTNTHTTVTSVDSSVTVVAGTNAAGAPEFDLSVDHPEYVDKDGNALADGAELMTVGAFADAAVPPPVGSKLFGLDAAGDCAQFDPPVGGAGGTQSSMVFVDAAETDAGALIRHSDGAGNDFDFCNGGKCYEQQLMVHVTPAAGGADYDPVFAQHQQFLPFGGVSQLPGNTCYGPCGAPPGGDLFEFDPADGGQIRVLRPGIYTYESYLMSAILTDPDLTIITELRINGSGPGSWHVGISGLRDDDDVIRTQGGHCFCITDEDIAAGPDGTYATVGTFLLVRNTTATQLEIYGRTVPQGSLTGTGASICGKVFECDDGA